MNIILELRVVLVLIMVPELARYRRRLVIDPDISIEKRDMLAFDRRITEMIS